MNNGFIPQLSVQEYDELYSKIMGKLKEPFPQGTVTLKNHNEKSAYIPVQAYIKKLNDAAGGFYSWQITSQRPTIHREEGLLEMRGALTILNTTNEGVGFQSFRYIKNTEKVANLDEVIRGAVHRALVNALNMFEAGWLDLAPYRKWGDIPGVGSENEANSSNNNLNENPRCKTCDIHLSNEEVNLIRLANWNIFYCSTHVPDFVRKKIK